MGQERFFKAVLIAWRDGAICCFCGGKLDLSSYGKEEPLAVTLEHKKAFSHGGNSELDNLKLAHRYCNNKNQPPKLTLSELESLSEEEKAIISCRQAKNRRKLNRRSEKRKDIRLFGEIIDIDRCKWECSLCRKEFDLWIDALDCCKRGAFRAE